MKSFFKEKKIKHKIIIAIIIVTLFNFMSPTISQAGIGGILFEPIKDLLLVIADGIISLSQTFIFDLDVSFLTIYHKDSGASTVLGVLAGIAIVVGGVIAAPFTGGLSLGLLVAGALGGYAVSKIVADAIPPTFKLPVFLLTPENMFSNSIPFLDINFFEGADAKGATQMDIDGDGNMDGYYIETTTTTGETVYQKSSALILKPTISSWYYAIRNFAIVALLSILVYTAIRIIISSSAEDKAKYKQKLFDWLIAMCLLFFMHYIMAFAVAITEAVTEAVNSFNQPIYVIVGSSGDTGGDRQLKDYKYGDGASEDEGQFLFDDNDTANMFRQNGVITTDTDSGEELFIWPTNLMGKARMELQLEPKDITEDDVEMRQFGYTVIYIVLVIYTILFLFRYLKRLLMLTFLTIIAPLMAMTYPLDKMQDGSAQGFNMWLKEYLFNLLIQPVHLILYTILMGSAMDLVQDNVIYAIVALGFLLEAEKLLRRFFGFDKASTVAGGSALGGALAMQGLNSITKFLGKGSKAGKSAGGKAVGPNAAKALTRGKDKGKDINDLYASGADALEARSLSGGNDTPSAEERAEAMVEMDAYLKGGERLRQETRRLNNKTGIEDDGATSNNRQMTSEERAQHMAETAAYLQGGEQARQKVKELNAKPGTLAYAELMEKKRKEGVKKLTLGERAGRAIKYYGPKVGKGIGRFATQTLPKAALKGTLAGTGAMIGLSAGLASDDFGNVAKWGAAGAVGGWTAGEGAETFVETKTRGLENLPAEFYGVTHSEDEIKAKRNEELDKAWAKDRDVVNKYAEQFGCGKAQAKEIMKEAKKFREYGITDDDVIIKAMKAEGGEFGAEKTASEQRILLAQLAGQVTSSKDADQVEARLKKRRFSEERAKAYADQIRRMKGLV